MDIISHILYTIIFIAYELGVETAKFFGSDFTKIIFYDYDSNSISYLNKTIKL